jgi:hypothetical protein
MQAGAGAITARDAVDRVIEITIEQLQGFWPEFISQKEGQSEGSPDIRSISKRLLGGDPRAQCFDYAALSVAFLRSIGLPARAATVLEPKAMEHPRHSHREIYWNFRVWTEVYMEGSWWGVDITYLDDDLKDQPDRNDTHTHSQADLQPVTGPWFAQMIGPDSHVWIQKGQRIIETTSRYQGISGYR